MGLSKCLVIAVLPLLAVWGCVQTQPETYRPYKTVAQDPERDTNAARAFTARAVALLDQDDLAGAELELKKALEADTFFGQAHNNLGTVYFHQKKFYLAAWEFQYACKLMPGKAKPRNNLGLVYEVVGKLEEATRSYEEAIKLEPDAVEIIANLARAYTRANRKDDQTRQLLKQIVLKDTREEWVSWARQSLATMIPADPSDSNSDIGRRGP